MAKIKDPQETNLKECAFKRCRKEFKPDFVDQIYCNPKCRNRAGVLRHMEKVIPDYLMGLSNDELIRLLGDRLGLRGVYGHKNLMIPERTRKRNEAKQ